MIRPDHNDPKPQKPGHARRRHTGKVKSAGIPGAHGDFPPLPPEQAPGETFAPVRPGVAQFRFFFISGRSVAEIILFLLIAGMAMWASTPSLVANLCGIVPTIISGLIPLGVAGAVVIILHPLCRCHPSASFVQQARNFS